jgi:cell division protein FtsB
MDGLMPRIAVGVMSLLAVAVMLLAVFNEKGMLSVNEEQRELDQMLQENELLRRKNADLEKQIHEHKTNPLMIEKKAREELDMAMPDEIIIETPDPEPAVSTLLT